MSFSLFRKYGRREYESNLPVDYLYKKREITWGQQANNRGDAKDPENWAENTG